jgi:hypothetical protein
LRDTIENANTKRERWKERKTDRRRQKQKQEQRYLHWQQLSGLKNRLMVKSKSIFTENKGAMKNTSTIFEPFLDKESHTERQIL